MGFCYLWFLSQIYLLPNCSGLSFLFRRNGFLLFSKKGGLMAELARRRIKVLEDKGKQSFKTAMKVDLVIAGSAVCASWIDQYMDHFPAGASQIAWWIMENRREYFDRAKVVLNQVKTLVFLSESESKQWQDWCEEEKIQLRSLPVIVPLSINDELAFVAGIACSLNTPSASTEKMLEKRQLLRDSVRKEMGLTDNDMLVISLSSINPGKGQLLLLDSARLVIEEKPVKDDPKIKNPVHKRQAHSTLGRKHHLRALLQELNDDDEYHQMNLLSDKGGTLKQSVKFLIGSVGSRSNKVVNVKELLGFLSQHSNLSKSVLWTPATTRVAALYSAADVYVMNSQGLGGTFGRVTIEAMAFGLPVLGTEAGGTAVLHEAASQLPPETPIEDVMVPEDVGFQIMTDVLD
ncbi:uncharacterized protein [Malus domestica]|uniref:uncharacterized protein n=1 Tax=Malus domestica TaxID=3750 RepID=UPI0039769DAA